MSWIYKLQKKFGKYAISNFSLYIVIIYVAGFILVTFSPGFYYSYLTLDIAKVLQGQVWRLITFVIYPPETDILYFLLHCYIFYMIGTQIETVIGAFQYNLYIYIGVLGHILAGFIIYFIGVPVYNVSLTFLYSSLIFLFSTIYPNAQFLLFFIIPIKAKWLGILNGVYFAYLLITGTLVARIMIVVSLLNFILFFFSMKKKSGFNASQTAGRRVKFDSKVKSAKTNKGKPLHRCAVCGQTELDDDTLEFRFCSKCDGNYEYCQNHLYTHIHVTHDSNKEQNHRY